MKKITNYMLLIMSMMIGFFCMNFSLVEAEDAEEEVEEEKIVVNPKSDGTAAYVFDVETKDDEGNVTDVQPTQFTKSRDISVSINYSEQELSSYDDIFNVCEIIRTNNATREQCSQYTKAEKKVYFQIVSANDGDKEIAVRFFQSRVKKLEVVKKIVLDTTGPVITLNGGEYLYIPLKDNYVEQNAVCTDDSLYTEGNCVVEVEKANIDKTIDTYQYVRYKAVDFLGNETNAVRKVLVEIQTDDTGNTLYWVGAGFGVAVLAALLFLQVWKNKEKQKNQSVL